MRIYFAGIFNAHIGHFDAEKLIELYKPKYLLDSFFYKKQCEKSICSVDINNFLLDSGAFSFMNGAKTSREKMNSYVNLYGKAAAMDDHAGHISDALEYTSQIYPSENKLVKFIRENFS